MRRFDTRGPESLPERDGRFLAIGDQLASLPNERARIRYLQWLGQDGKEYLADLNARLYEGNTEFLTSIEERENDIRKYFAGVARPTDDDSARLRFLFSE